VIQFYANFTDAHVLAFGSHFTQDLSSAPLLNPHVVEHPVAHVAVELAHAVHTFDTGTYPDEQVTVPTVHVLAPIKH